MCRDRHIDVGHLPAHVLSDSPKPRAGEGASLGQFEYTPMPLKTALEEPEKRIIEAALRLNQWNRQTTAEMLDINRTTLYKKMKHYGLEFDPAKHR